MRHGPRFKGWTSHGQCVLYLFLSRILGCRSLRSPKANCVKTRLMETALLVALGLIVGLAIAGLAIFVGRQRGAGCRSRRGAARGRAGRRGAARRPAQWSNWARGSQAMGELLAKAQTQLQSSVNERLDAVTQHLGTLDADHDQAHHREPAEAATSGWR